jgi:hypothetical protein
MAILLCAVLVAGLCPAQTPKGLDDYKKIYETQSASIDSECDASKTTALKSYGTAIDSLKARAQSAGDLTALLACKKEAERFAKERTVPKTPPPGTHASIAQVMSSYHAMVTGADNTRITKLSTLTQSYLRALNALKKHFVQQGKIDDALAADTELKRVQFIAADVASRIPSPPVASTTVARRTTPSRRAGPVGTAPRIPHKPGVIHSLKIGVHASIVDCPDSGPYGIAATREGRIFIWNLETGEIHKDLAATGRLVEALCSRDGRFVMAALLGGSGGKDSGPVYKVYCWRMADGQLASEAAVAGTEYCGCGFISGLPVYAVASKDKGVLVRELPPGSKNWELPKLSNVRGPSLSWPDDFSFVLSKGKSRVEIVDSKQGDVLHTFPRLNRLTRISGDGTAILFWRTHDASLSNVQVADARTGKMHALIDPKTVVDAAFYAIGLSQDGRLLFGTQKGKQGYAVCEARTGKVLEKAVMAGVSHRRPRAAFTADPRCVMLCSGESLYLYGLQK